MRPGKENKMTMLKVSQYYPQLDSATAHGDRMCFSSTCAMAIKFLKPDALLGSNADDVYLRTVLKYGDTTNPSAQIRACKDYGVTATYRQTGRKDDLINEIQLGFPVATGFLHHGYYTAPYGGGHWALLIGYTDSYGIFHDPYGELDNVNGGYPTPGKGGKQIAYSWQRWLPRWAVKGPGDGWYMTFRPAN
jgi:hypothetical protein